MEFNHLPGYIKKDEYLDFRKENFKKFKISKWEVSPLFRRNHWDPNIIYNELELIKDIKTSMMVDDDKILENENKHYDAIIVDTGKSLKILKGNLSIKKLDEKYLSYHTKKYAFSLDKQAYFNNFSFLNAYSIIIERGKRVKILGFFNGFNSFKRQILLKGDDVVDVELYGNNVFNSEHWIFEVKNGEEANISLFQGLNKGRRLVTYDIVINKEASLSFLTSNVGTANNRGRTNSFIIGEGGLLVEGNIVYARNQIGDYLSVIYHLNENTRSISSMRALAADKSKILIKGIVKVAKQAPGSEAYFYNKGLIIGDGNIDSIPSLEIENNKVKVSHSSSIAYLDEDKIYYLLTRGIEKELAKKILIGGFINDGFKENFEIHTYMRIRTLLSILKREERETIYYPVLGE